MAPLDISLLTISKAYGWPELRWTILGTVHHLGHEADPL
jgi:hypothetical protein